MWFNENQISFDTGSVKTITHSEIEFRDIIIDRKSKYSVIAFKVDSQDEVKSMFKKLKQDNYYRKATHNTYAYRIKLDNWSVLEWKNDDGEQWAWLCILRELQRENAQWMMLVVTRYFWGIQLHGDRFRNVVDACKIFFQKINRHH